MTASLTVAEHSKLIRVLELVRSPIDGEALAAARAADRILADRHFADVWPVPAITHSGSQARSRSPTPRPFSLDPWRTQAEYCSQHATRLTEWESHFCRDVLRQSTLSTKQAARLNAIFQKVKAAQEDQR